MTRLVALGVAAALVLAGAIVLATSPWSEDEPEARMRTVPAEPEPVTLRVMTFNILYGGDELDLATGDWCARRAGCQRTFDRVVAAVEASDADIVGLQETTLDSLDITSAEMLEKLVTKLRADGIELVVAEAHAPVVAFARRTGLLDVLREDHVYPTVDAAVRALETRNVATPAPQ